jgi:hypothetical protein
LGIDKDVSRHAFVGGLDPTDAQAVRAWRRTAAGKAIASAERRAHVQRLIAGTSRAPAIQGELVRILEQLKRERRPFGFG